MKNLMLYLALILVTEPIAAQEPLTPVTVKAHQFYLHHYPTDLITGNIAFGLEHMYKKKLSHEFSFGVRSFNPIDDYNKGYRLDYLIKYNWYTGKIFRFSSNLSFTHRNNYCVNRPIEYNYQDASGAPTSQARLTAVEDRRLKDFGFGLGVSLNFKVFKKFFVGADITLNRANYELNYSNKAVINGEIQGSSYGHTTDSGIYTIPYVRLKISYLLGRH